MHLLLMCCEQSYCSFSYSVLFLCSIVSTVAINVPGCRIKRQIWLNWVLVIFSSLPPPNSLNISDHHIYPPNADSSCWAGTGRWAASQYRRHWINTFHRPLPVSNGSIERVTSHPSQRCSMFCTLILHDIQIYLSIKVWKIKHPFLLI